MYIIVYVITVVSVIIAYISIQICLGEREQTRIKQDQLDKTTRQLKDKLTKVQELLKVDDGKVDQEVPPEYKYMMSFQYFSNDAVIGLKYLLFHTKGINVIKSKSDLENYDAINGVVYKLRGVILQSKKLCETSGDATVQIYSKKSLSQIRSFVKYCNKLGKKIEMKKIHQSDDETLIYKYDDKNGWENTWVKNTKSYKTVFLNKNNEDFLCGDIKQFKVTESDYISRCSNWQRGYIFYGKPGCGKTSLIRAIAREEELPIYIFNFGKIINATQLEDMFAKISSCSPYLCVFEDIDSYSTVWKRDDKMLTQPTQTQQQIQIVQSKCGDEKKDVKEPILLSDFLNALDGLGESNGRIIIFTTNCIDKIDDALLRPGRIDVRMELGLCDKYQFVNITTRMYGKKVNINLNKCKFKENIYSPAQLIEFSKTKTFVDYIHEICDI